MKAIAIETSSGSATTADDARPEAGGATLPRLTPEPVNDVRKMQDLIERQYRANRTLAALVHKLVGDRPARTVVVAPRLAVANLTQQPRRIAGPAIDDAWWNSGAVRPEQPLWAMPGHEAYSLGDTVDEVVGYSVFGLSGEDLDRVVGLIAGEQRREKDFKPVFLTDCPDFHPFVRRGYAFEYVSNFRSFVGGGVERVASDKVETATAKWAISRLVDRNEARSIDRSYPPLAALLRHNGGMSRECRRQRFEWIAETLRIALNSERYDAAEGLAGYLGAFLDEAPAESRVAAARVICRKHVAFGEVDRLRAFLFANIALAREDDYLFTLFSMHCTPETSLSRDFATLPGGKPNCAYISRRLSVGGDDSLPVLMAAGGLGGAETELLLANHFAHRRDDALYATFLNRYLARVGETRIARVSLGDDNVLKHLVFEARAPAKQQTDLITVVMSAHNAAETIEYAVRSILGQTHGNLELLICDDESSDGTAEILRRMPSDPRVRLFRSNARQGTYNIRNSLIAEARGTFVTFHDADDLAMPDRLERQLGFLKARNAAAVVGQWFRISPQGEVLFSTDQRAARLAVVSLLAPTAVFRRFLPYRSARFGADTEFFERLRMALGVEAVAMLEAPLVFGLASETSLTRSAGIEASEDGYRAPARRAYAAAAARSRQIGPLPSEEAALNRTLADWNILMNAAGIVSLTGEAS